MTLMKDVKEFWFEIVSFKMFLIPNVSKGSASFLYLWFKKLLVIWVIYLLLWQILIAGVELIHITEIVSDCLHVFMKLLTQLPTIMIMSYS